MREDPDYVIRRYESGNYASNEATRKEYLKVIRHFFPINWKTTLIFDVLFSYGT